MATEETKEAKSKRLKAARDRRYRLRNKRAAGTATPAELLELAGHGMDCMEGPDPTPDQALADLSKTVANITVDKTEVGVVESVEVKVDVEPEVPTCPTCEGRHGGPCPMEPDPAVDDIPVESTEGEETLSHDLLDGPELDPGRQQRKVRNFPYGPDYVLGSIPDAQERGREIHKAVEDVLARTEKGPVWDPRNLKGLIQGLDVGHDKGDMSVTVRMRRREDGTFEMLDIKTREGVVMVPPDVWADRMISGVWDKEHATRPCAVSSPDACLCKGDCSCHWEIVARQKCVECSVPREDHVTSAHAFQLPEVMDIKTEEKPKFMVGVKKGEKVYVVITNGRQFKPSRVRDIKTGWTIYATDKPKNAAATKRWMRARTVGLVEVLPLSDLASVIQLEEMDATPPPPTLALVPPEPEAVDPLAVMAEDGCPHV